MSTRHWALPLTRVNLVSLHHTDWSEPRARGVPIETKPAVRIRNVLGGSVENKHSVTKLDRICPPVASRPHIV